MVDSFAGERPSTRCRCLPAALIGERSWRQDGRREQVPDDERGNPAAPYGEPTAQGHRPSSGCRCRGSLVARSRRNVRKHSVFSRRLLQPIATGRSAGWAGRSRCSSYFWAPRRRSSAIGWRQPDPARPVSRRPAAGAAACSSRRSASISTRSGCCGSAPA